MNIELRNLQPSDKDVIKYSLSKFQKMNNNDDISVWFDLLLADKSSYNKAVIDSTNKKLIGYAGISQISDINSSGEYFIFIGDKSYHGNGIGTFITKEIVKRGFQELGLNSITLTVSEKNVGAIKAYKNADFKTEGIMRQAFYRDGNFHGKIIMSIIKEEWIYS